MNTCQQRHKATVCNNVCQDPATVSKYDVAYAVAISNLPRLQVRLLPTETFHKTIEDLCLI